MVIEEERPIIGEPSPISTPELDSRSPYPGSDSPEIKVVPLSELSNIFSHGLPKTVSDSDDKDDDVSLNLSPSPQLNDEVVTNGDDIESSLNKDSVNGDINNESDITNIDKSSEVNGLVGGKFDKDVHL